jgi:hypothetical protein
MEETTLGAATRRLGPPAPPLGRNEKGKERAEREWCVACTTLAPAPIPWSLEVQSLSCYGRCHPWTSVMTAGTCKGLDHASWLLFWRTLETTRFRNHAEQNTGNNKVSEPCGAEHVKAMYCSPSSPNVFWNHK